MTTLRRSWSTKEEPNNWIAAAHGRVPRDPTRLFAYDTSLRHGVENDIARLQNAAQYTDPRPHSRRRYRSNRAEYLLSAQRVRRKSRRTAAYGAEEKRVMIPARSDTGARKARILEIESASTQASRIARVRNSQNSQLYFGNLQGRQEALLFILYPASWELSVENTIENTFRSEKFPDGRKEKG